jgi:hypothetical protein
MKLIHDIIEHDLINLYFDFCKIYLKKPSVLYLNTANLELILKYADIDFEHGIDIKYQGIPIIVDENCDTVFFK